MPQHIKHTKYNAYTDRDASQMETGIFNGQSKTG